MNVKSFTKKYEMTIEDLFICIGFFLQNPLIPSIFKIYLMKLFIAGIEDFNS